MSPEECEWLKGPELVAWLLKHHILAEENPWLDNADETRIRRWREGSAANLHVADRILCQLGVCLGELPDDLYREPPERGTTKQPLDPKTRKRIVALARQGMNYAEIGRKVGVCQKTAAKHAKEAMA